MRSLLLAGAVLATVSTSPADAWTQSLLHPENRDAVATAMPVPPRTTGTGGGPRRLPLRTTRPLRQAEPTRPSDPPAWPSCPWC
ncbi:hypothetical protein FF100_18865 [Methylobacterium terricola]|uniref:Uncharacterized protein n=1 Tax=Methylobacterium terricola TaxID=2583531 RepID=A0A5C4LH03_9HYPH|nr:hypothetical protein [Methylobacterium terricola]TNC11699.1 hypothetical protein FF100_18865 [Methylobacterium terricola]